MENDDQAGGTRSVGDIVGAWVLCALLLAGLVTGSLLRGPTPPEIPGASLEVGCPPGHRSGMEVLATPDADYRCAGDAPLFAMGAEGR